MTNPLPAWAHASVSTSFCRFFCLALAVVAGSGTLLTGDVSAGPGASSPQSIVEREIARRQELVDAAKQAIVEGDELVERREFGSAVEKYFAAYSSTDESALAQPVHQLARSRFASFSVIYARELAQGARYDDANKALDRVLAPDVFPDHAAATTLKKQLADPERYNPALTPDHLEAVSKVNKLFALAEGYMDLGNFDMANLTYASILREDPTNNAARRGMAAADLKISDYHDSARDHFRSKALSNVDEAWELQVPLSDQAFQEAFALHGATVSNAISDRLRNIIVPQVDFTDESLAGVADYLTRLSKELDPTGEGVNFVVQLGQEDADLRDISINLILNNAPLGEVLRFATESSGTKFRIDQFAVVITSLNSASTELITRSFVVPPDFLSSPPQATEAGNADPFASGTTNSRSLITRRLSARQYLEQSGVSFPDGSNANHIVSTNTLIVRNTQSNLDLVEALVINLTKGTQNMVRIALTQVEINMAENNELSFDQLLGAFNIPGSSGVFGAGAGGNGAAGEFAFTPPGSDVPVGQNSITNGIRSGDFALNSSAIDNVADGNPISSAGTAKAPSAFGISSVFSDPQYQMAIRAINQRKGSSVANQPATVTRPGQRSVIEVFRSFPFPTEYDPPEIPQSFSSERNDLVLIDPVNQLIIAIPGQEPSNAFPVTPAHPTAFDVRNVGTRFEVEPTIDPNGYVVTLNMSIEFSQFEGFINYGTPITTTDGTVLTDNRILQPLFKVSRLAQPVHVQDGANFVIGGIMNDDVEFTNDKVPFMAEVPLVGRLFKGNVNERRRKAVLFFVNVQIIDPSGQRVNRELSSTGL